MILGCTEIVLPIGQGDRTGFPVFDTTALHIETAVACALGGAETTLEPVSRLTF